MIEYKKGTLMEMNCFQVDPDKGKATKSPTNSRITLVWREQSISHTILHHICLALEIHKIGEIATLYLYGDFFKMSEYVFHILRQTEMYNSRNFKVTTL